MVVCLDVLHALGFSEPDITVAPPPTPVSQLPSASQLSSASNSVSFPPLNGKNKQNR